jgi:hypothetical protein
MIATLFAAHPALTPALWAFCVLFGGVGLIALASPRLFASLARVGNRWIDTSRFFSKFDAQVDLDSKVLPHSRWLGAAVVGAVAVVWGVLGR